jgi:hypothetical protein
MCPLCLCKVMIEAIQCKVDDAGDEDGAATMMTTGGGAGAAKGNNGVGVSTL